MAAGNRSSLSNPFGYTFPSHLSTNNPPSGPPLLDHDESNTLQSFFNDPDHFANADGLLDHALANLGAGNDSRHSLLSPDAQWLYPQDTQFPPAFPSQHDAYPTQHQTFPHTNTNLAASPEDLLTLVGIPANRNPPDDVLHAASTLFMYRANQLPEQLPDQLPDQRARNPRQQSPAQRHASFPFNTPPAMQQYPPPNHHFRASFDSQTPNSHQASHNHTHQHTPIYHFGSDNNFRQNGYTAPYQGLEDAAAQPHIDFVHGMVSHSNGGASSVENSVPHTPIIQRNDQKFYPASLHAFADQAEQHDFQNPKQRKRRKTRDFEQDNDQYQKVQSTSPAFNQNSSPDDDSAIGEASPAADAEDMTVASQKRRRASSGANGKSASLSRKNLTEEQKRSNHIKSEQKRRNIIKQGYQDLNELVPNLKTGGFSKSAVLTETTRFLEELQAGNDRMESYLRQLAVQNGVPFD